MKKIFLLLLMTCLMTGNALADEITAGKACYLKFADVYNNKVSGLTPTALPELYFNVSTSKVDSDPSVVYFESTGTENQYYIKDAAGNYVAASTNDWDITTTTEKEGALAFTVTLDDGKYKLNVTKDFWAR